MLRRRMVASRRSAGRFFEGIGKVLLVGGDMPAFASLIGREASPAAPTEGQIDYRRRTGHYG